MTDQILAEAKAPPFVLHLGDCIEVLRGMADASVDSIVTDPPYELGFMGKSWDATGIANSVELWAEALRVLKPGGHMLAFSHARTYHRMTCAIEDAGFEVRDQMMWLYGSGFPKSRDVGKAIDSEAGAAREVIGTKSAGASSLQRVSRVKQGYRENLTSCDTASIAITAPATDDARQWDGWGTALKPAHEPICVARKPLSKGLTVAGNVLEHGTGAINVEACRVGAESTARHTLKEMSSRGAAGDSYANQDHRYADRSSKYPTGSDSGRWPANIIHDGSAEVVELFPAQAGASAPVRGTEASAASVGRVTGERDRVAGAFHGDTGSAARFFYCAKASRSDRNEGLTSGAAPAVDTDATMRDCETADWSNRNGNHHPTVKPTDLMAYLCRLVTPPGGKVLDMFMGSGSTGKACMREGFEFVGIDMTAEFLPIAKARIEHEANAVAESARLAAIPPPQLNLFEETAC